jgi:ubiquinone/menaquinone biosynthesis C-methylase UbiE
MPGEEPQLLEELVQVHDRDVLDVGCGEGGLARRLARKGARVTGIDPLPSALENARAKELSPGSESSPGSLRYVQGAAEALPFAAASFDLVIFLNSLHHVPAEAMDEALSEAARVLRPEGTLYVQEPLAEGPFFELLLMVEDETEVRAAAQHALDRASAARFAQLARRDALIALLLADFEALRAHMVSVEPARAAAFERHDRALRAAFERLGRRVQGGYEFDTPLRIEVLQPSRR